MSDPLDYLDSDDLVSWLLLNPESVSEDLAVDSCLEQTVSVDNWLTSSSDINSNGLLTQTTSTSSSTFTNSTNKPSKKRSLPRASSSASLVSNVSDDEDDEDLSNDNNHNGGGSNSTKPVKMDTSRKKLMKMAELENKIKRITKGKLIN